MDTELMQSNYIISKQVKLTSKNAHSLQSCNAMSNSLGEAVFISVLN